MNRPSIRRWKAHFAERGITEELSSAYISYIKTLYRSDVPVIFEFEHLSRLLGVTPAYLASVINAPEYHYREFRIPKRRGGTRLITAPYPALRNIQTWIYESVLAGLTVHSSAHGFVPHKSILTNALSHKGSNDLLKIDVEDFFGSISMNRVIDLFQRLGYTQSVSYYLSALCCLDEVLPQGSPASPAISNIVCYVMDKRLSGISSAYGLTHTRYADDLAFSGGHIPLHFVGIVDQVLQENAFHMNRSKTRLIRGRGRRKILTGLDVTSDNLRVPRDFRRRLRQELYYIEKYGFYSHVSKLKIRNPNYLLSLLGKLNFWRQVEPENEWVLASIRRLEELRSDDSAR